MKRRRLIWKVAPMYLALIACATAAIAWYAGGVVSTAYEDQVANGLEEKANLLAPTLLRQLVAEEYAAIDSLCKRNREPAGMRITVIRSDGKVIGDSDRDPALMDNHQFRPEIVEAMTGKIGRSTRFSKTIGQQLIYIARPLEQDERVVGVIRTSIALADMNRALSALYLRIALGGLIVALITTCAGLAVFHRKISGPLKQVENGAKRFAEGDLTQTIPVTDPAEIATLATAMNKMARQMNERIHAATQQTQEQQAVLSSMIEGVIAVDSEERVITINIAAARWMDVDHETAHGRKSYEVIRNMRLQDLIARALDSGQPVVDELSIRGTSQRLFLHAQAAPIQNKPGGNAGVVIVLHDVTRLRQLEAVRQEFVANVSHELKTPIAAIKGAVETVLDDLGIDEESAAPSPHAAETDQALGSETSRETPSQHNHDSIRRFLPVIARQADRLNAIVEDLLTLARIEADEQEQHLTLELDDVEPILREAMEICQSRANEKQIDVSIQVPDRLQGRLNPPLIVQAVVNLLDNAIKYTPIESKVELSAELANGELTIAVRDNGPGIEKQHLPRIFERFYRTDRARSRAVGGTGLGLAIVKHIAQAHRGRVSVESHPGAEAGHGSVFCIHLPG